MRQKGGRLSFMRADTGTPGLLGSLKHKALVMMVMGGLVSVGTTLPWVVSPTVAFASSSSLSIDYQVSVNGTTWQDVGIGVLQDPQIILGDKIYERVIVTNTGTTALTNVQVLSTGSPATFTFGSSSTVASLSAGQTVTSHVAAATAQTGHQVDMATASGTVSGTTTTVSASDQADYTGVAGSVAIDKQISVNDGQTWLDVGNGVLQNLTVPVGSSVKERVLMTNTGGWPITGATVTDVGGNGPSNFTFGGSLTTTVAVGATLTSDVATVTAIAGTQVDTATVSGTITDGTNTQTVTAADQAAYTGDASTPPTLSGIVSPGSTVGTTAVTVSSLPSGDTLDYRLATTAQSAPAVGSSLPGGTTTYTSGSNISGVASGGYVDLYAVNGSGVVQAWNQFPVTTADIREISVWTPPTLSAESVTVDGMSASVIGNMGYNPVLAIRTGSFAGYVEERAAIAAGATFAGEVLDSSYLSAILDGSGVGLQQHVSAVQQGQFAALYQKLGIIPTWTHNAVSAAAGVKALEAAGASALSIENYLVQVYGYAWSTAQGQAQAGFPL